MWVLVLTNCQNIMSEWYIFRVSMYVQRMRRHCRCSKDYSNTNLCTYKHTYVWMYLYVCLHVMGSWLWNFHWACLLVVLVRLICLLSFQIIQMFSSTTWKSLLVFPFFRWYNGKIGYSGNIFTLLQILQQSMKYIHWPVSYCAMYLPNTLLHWFQNCKNDFKLP